MVFMTNNFFSGKICIIKFLFAYSNFVFYGQLKPGERNTSDKKIATNGWKDN